MPSVLRVDHPSVMHEMIDDEVVVIHLDTGIYYSLDGVAGRLWQYLAAGKRTAEDVVAFAGRIYDGDAAVIATAVERFLGQLRDEQLAFVSDEESSTPADDAVPAARQPFSEPTLQKYTDMESLLLADPIHEVDEGAGWPHLK